VHSIRLWALEDGVPHSVSESETESESDKDSD